jgi:hypothetical protein
MGYYINPANETKEEFLAKYGTPLNIEDVVAFDFSSDRLPVCLLNNGPFTAAGIAYDPREAQEFLRPDPRPRKWFSVSRASLKPYL